MIRNFLKGSFGDWNNPLLAAIGFKLKKRFNQLVLQIAIWLQIVLDMIRAPFARDELKFLKQSF
ncbi:hypothetical protein [Maribacter sp. 2307ULW6-5]|uniref:hypothetical protein n=1 Tax=Maribacter sp. 2307ULW6-5 TaxID=3386275 RepID=UPI0039BD7E11